MEIAPFGSEVNIKNVPHLECSHYDILGEKHRKMEMYWSNEIRDKVKDIGFKRIRRYLDSDMGKISSQRSSIDPGQDEHSVKLRLVGEAVGLSKLLGMPIAIKRTGKGLAPGNKDRENLVEQYLFMRQLEIDSKKLLPSEVQKHFKFCPVYGVIRHPSGTDEQYYEWLIMEHIKNTDYRAQWVFDIEQGKSRMLGFNKAGFDAKEHPWLVESFGLSKQKPTWHSLQMKLYNMGLKVSDLAGRNVLWTQDFMGQKSYTVIDQRKK